jgi:hypothetical protein|tara:strand:+ start:161 stop:424 length:264 start_codon:yes stop_codon:yes gene_type:complete
MRKKFFKGTVPRIIKESIKKKLRKDPVSEMLRDPKMVVKAPTKEMKEAKEQFKKLIDTYKNKPLDDEGVKKGFKIFTKKPYESIKKK